LFVFLYHFVWTLAAFFFLPLIPFMKGRRFLERTGLILPNDIPGNRNIWIHALSVGEVLSARPLIKAIKQKHPEKEIIFSVTTTQGMKIAREELKDEVKELITMPIDFWFSMRRVMNYINPLIFILIETDLWPGLIQSLKNRGVKTVLINGRVSPQTFKSYRRVRFFTRIMLNSLELCLVQSDLDRDRLLLAGIDPGRVKTIGNIKFDRDRLAMDEKEYKHLIKLLNLEEDNIIWVAGSTHAGEDEIILDVFKKLRISFPLLCLIIAPREIERSNDIYSQSLDRGFKAVLKTELGVKKKSYEVLILNTIGELGRIYGIAKISFVGGSLVPVGGHNLLEPSSFGCPVLFGHHTHNFVLMSQLLIEVGGGRRVNDGDDLFAVVKELLSDREKAESMGKRAEEFVKRNKGALKQVMDNIGPWM